MGNCETDRNMNGETRVTFSQQNPTNIDLSQFYDVIVSINSIKDINNGWNIKFSNRFRANYPNLINQNVLKIGIIGNSNKGKSFILSKLSKINLPSGTSIKTEGLSIKYPEMSIYKNRRITLLDSAGLETPVLTGNSNNLQNQNIGPEAKNNN